MTIPFELQLNRMKVFVEPALLFHNSYPLAFNMTSHEPNQGDTPFLFLLNSSGIQKKKEVLAKPDREE